jgi:hypothetical protein
VKQIFQISSGKVSETNYLVLSIRLGEKHCCFSITDFATKELQQLSYYTAEDVNESFLWDLLTAHPELNELFYQVLVCYDFPQSTLVPIHHYKHEDDELLLKTFFGVNGTSTIVSETVTDWQVQNIYAVPKDVHEWMQKNFTNGKYWHQYTVSIKNYPSTNAGNSVQIDFRENEFLMLVINNNKLLLAQTYLYSTPGDVVYYILKTCRQFGLSQQNTNIQLSGLIDRQSALYIELSQYFFYLTFRNPSWVISDSAKSESPLHFFTSLNDLFQCAS